MKREAFFLENLVISLLEITALSQRALMSQPLIPLISQHNFIVTAAGSIMPPPNNNRMFYTVYSTRCQVTDDPKQGLSTIWPYRHKHRQFEAQCMGKYMTLKQQIYLCATLCVLGPSGFSKPLMVFSFAHC